MLTHFGVAILGHNEIEREGLRRILTEQSVRVLGAYRDHLDLDLDEETASSDADPLVLIDAASDEERLEACRHIHARWPKCKIVILAADCQGQTVLEAFHAGINGYVSKHISVDSLTEMLKLVSLGEKMFPSQVFFDLAELKVDRSVSASNMTLADANLSDREMAILQGLIRGDANKVISRKISITEATVKVHVKSILRKLGVMNRTQAAIWGITRGLAQAEGIVPTPMIDRWAPVHAPEDRVLCRANGHF